MKKIITENENLDIKVTVEIDEKKYQYLTKSSKEHLCDSFKQFYDRINYAICHADPDNNIPIEKAMKKKSRDEKDALAKKIFFDAPYIYKDDCIETKIDGKYMSFNRDDCIVAIYNNNDVSPLTRNSIAIIYKEKLFGKLQTNFEDINTMKKCRSIISLVEDACYEYWDKCNRGKATFMISALRELNDFSQVNVAFTAIEFIKKDFDAENDPEMFHMIKEVEEALYSKLTKDAKIEVINPLGCKVSLSTDSAIFDTRSHNNSCENSKEEDDDEEFL